MYLADLLLRVGHNFEILLQDYLLSIPDYRKIAKGAIKDWNIGTYRLLENQLPQPGHNLNIAEKFVFLRPTFETIYPLKSEKNVNWNDMGDNDKFKIDDTYWWRSYTTMKHNAKFEEANLDIILKALAALFV